MAANQEENNNQHVTRRRIGDLTLIYQRDTLEHDAPSSGEQETQFQAQRESNGENAIPEAIDLGRLLLYVASHVVADKVEDMRCLYNLSVAENARCSESNAQRLFEVMETHKYVSRSNLAFLQMLLWETGQKDLFDEVGRRGKKLRRDDQDVAHFFVPSLRPVNGYSYIHLHVNKGFSVQEQEDYRKMLADIMKIDIECIQLRGILPSNSFWLTFLVPKYASSQLLKSLLDENEKFSFQMPKVDKISFLQTTLPSDLDNMTEDSDTDEEGGVAWDLLTHAKKTPGHWLTYRVPDTAHSGLLADLQMEGSDSIFKLTDANLDTINFLQKSPRQLAESEDKGPSSESRSHHETPKLTTKSNGFVHASPDACAMGQQDASIDSLSQLPDGAAPDISKSFPLSQPYVPAPCTTPEKTKHPKRNAYTCRKEFSEGVKRRSQNGHITKNQKVKQ